MREKLAAVPGLGHALHGWESFLDYGRLPAGKLMLNWPFRANDSPMSVELVESADSTSFTPVGQNALDIRVVEIRQTIELLTVRSAHVDAGLMEQQEGVEGRLRDLPLGQEIVEVLLGSDFDEDLISDGARRTRKERGSTECERHLLQGHGGFGARGVPKSPSP